jgi:hypothetical protein
MAQHNKSFCAAFFKKRPLPYIREAGLNLQEALEVIFLRRQDEAD